MKKVVVLLTTFIIAVIIVLTFAKDATVEQIKWDCSVIIPENSDQIIFSETLIKTNTGELNIQNQSGVDITLYLYDSQDKTEIVRELYMQTGAAGILYQIDTNREYCIGIQSDTSSTVEVTIIISNVSDTDPYSGSVISVLGMK
ncbi:MAG: hypothetical protein R3Y06_04785 [Faecalibacterium sp.]